MNKKLFDQNKTRHFKGLGKLVGFTADSYVFSFKGRKTFVPFGDIKLPDRTTVKADLNRTEKAKSIQPHKVIQPRGYTKPLVYKSECQL